LLDKLIENFSSNYSQSKNSETDPVCQIQALGLSALLNFTTNTIDFAALKLKEGQQLQSMLVYQISSFMCAG